MQQNLFDDVELPQAKKQEKRVLTLPKLRSRGRCSFGTYDWLEGKAGQRKLNLLCQNILDYNNSSEVKNKTAEPMWVCCDLETTGLNPLDDRILLFAFATRGSHAYVFSPDDLDESLFVKVLASAPIVNHNIKFDYEFWKAKYGIDITIYWDTYLTHALATCGLKPWIQNNRLDTLTKRYTGVSLDKSVTKLFYTSPNWKVQEAIAYAGEDVLATIRLIPVTKSLLEKTEMTATWEQYERPLVPVLVDIELEGVPVDREYILKLRGEYQVKVAERIAVWEKIAPGVAHNSYPQKLEYFAKEIGLGNLPKIIDKKTNKEKISFDKESLPLIDHPGARALLAIQEVEIILNTYLVPWSTLTTDLISEEDTGKPRYGVYREATTKSSNAGDYGAIHTSFNQMDTDTGRFVSVSPNLQNIPRDQMFRTPFRGLRGEKTITCDFSGIELRILAELAGDKNMLEAFYLRDRLLKKLKAEKETLAPKELTQLKRDIDLSDLHTQTAITLFNLDKNKIDLKDPKFKELRAQTKSIGFGIPYQRGPAAIAAQINQPINKTRALIKNYFKTYVQIEADIEKTKQSVRCGSLELALQFGFPGREVAQTKSIDGRKRFYIHPVLVDPWEDQDKVKSQKASIERQAVNQPVQSTSATIIKLAMINLHRELKARYPKAKIRLSVHDELVVTCPAHQAEEVADLQVYTMEEAGRAILKKVPVEVSLEIADTWVK